ncbi:hypothetical protein PAECIP111892_00930 [Paenibacillus auburnensis]|uniref:Uncharacterized protein n=1 Tax=Paenibacillus auburnensis TaxID=2905649 RepID=A0ABN8G067_9BACL|nr:hypothetical protein PAECIP111892_00930 [Paenibacillus auburnensis]
MALIYAEYTENSEPNYGNHNCNNEQAPLSMTGSLA